MSESDKKTKIRRRRITKLFSPHLPVELAVVNHREHTQGLHGRHGAHGDLGVADLDDVDGVVVSLGTF